MAYRHILLIDDDEEDQEIFGSALEQTDIDCKFNSCSDAREAFEKLTQQVLRPDLIFLDVNMPGMNGPEFLELVKATEALNTIPVIMFSTSADPKTVARTKQLGAMDYITKPSRFDDLVTKLQTILT